MRDYEMIYITDAALDEEQTNALVQRFSDLVTDRGGVVDRVERWGKRRLAYTIADHREGDYTVMHFKADASITGELDRQMKLADQVVRHMLVRNDTPPAVPEEEPAEPEGEAAGAEESTAEPAGAAGAGEATATEEAGGDAGTGEEG